MSTKRWSTDSTEWRFQCLCSSHAGGLGLLGCIEYHFNFEFSAECLDRHLQRKILSSEIRLEYTRVGFQGYSYVSISTGYQFLIEDFWYRLQQALKRPAVKYREKIPPYKNVPHHFNSTCSLLVSPVNHARYQPVVINSRDFQPQRVSEVFINALVNRPFEGRC